MDVRITLKDMEEEAKRNSKKQKCTMDGKAKKIFVPMCCDFVHIGHLNILNQAASKGEVTVLLMTDQAMRAYKRSPAMPYEHRKQLVESLVQVSNIIPCEGPQCYAPLAREHKPDVFVHGDDWKTGPQQKARKHLIAVTRNYGGTVFEPGYTDNVSSTASQNAFRCSLTGAKHLGMLTRTALNDTKRDVEVAARESNLGKATLDRMLDGNELDGFNVDMTTRLLCNLYPIPKRHLVVDRDTSDGGAWFMSAKQTKDSARIFNRTNANGDHNQYYRYMDTATSGLSPFKPELIEELVEVSNNDPMNPLVVMNKGHLLGQATYFIGPVNFYWTVRGERRCKIMNTGDTCLITPYVPHSFTSRDLSQHTAIVAATYSGVVREALPQLLHLDSESVLKCAGDLRTPDSVRASRINRFIELRGLDAASVQAALEAQDVSKETAASAMNGKPVEQPVAAALALITGVSEGDFYVSPFTKDHEVVFEKACPNKPGKFAFAFAQHMADVGGYEWHIPQGRTKDVSQFYQYMYNCGKVSLNVEWTEPNGKPRKQRLAPNDSVVFKPFIKIVAEPEQSDALVKLVVFKAAGCLTSEVLKEITSFAPEGRARMTANVERWF